MGGKQPKSANVTFEYRKISMLVFPFDLLAPRLISGPCAGNGKKMMSVPTKAHFVAKWVINNV